MLLGRQRQIAALFALLKAAVEVGPQLPGCPVQRHRVVEIEERRLRQEWKIIEERRQPAFEEAGKQRFHAEGGNPFANLFDSLADPGGGGGDAFRGVPRRRLRGLPGLLGEEQLARRGQVDLFAPIHRPLRLQIEYPDRIDPVAEKLQPDRVLVEGRIDVDDSAADGKRAHVLDERRRLVAHFDELSSERVPVVLLPDADQLRKLVHRRRRKVPSIQRPKGEDERPDARALP